MNNPATDNARTDLNAVLEKIATNVFHIPTIAYRNSDALDFHEVSVGQIKRALRAAYEAGRQSMK